MNYLKKIAMVLLVALGIGLTAEAQCTLQTSMSYTSLGNNQYALSGSVTGGSGHFLYYWYVDQQSYYSSGANPFINITLPTGWHGVCFNVYDSVGGCIDSTCRQINNTPAPCNLGTTVSYTSLGYNQYSFSAPSAGASSPWNLQKYWTVDGSTAMNGNNSLGWMTGPGPYQLTILPGLHTVCVLSYDTLTGCTDSICQSINIPQPTGCSSLSVSIFDTMYTAGTHTEYTQVTGSTGTLNYLWSSGSTASYVSTTVNGQYCVTVTEANGCSATACINVIAQPCNMQVWVTDTQISPTSHYAVAHVGGGNGSYSYAWNHTGGSGSYCYAATSGNYCVTVSDGAGCTASACTSINVSPCANLHVSIIDTTSGGPGRIEYAYVSGSTTSLTYNWSNGSTASYINVNTTGQYCVTVTETNGCTASACYTVNISCSGNANYYSNYVSQLPNASVYVFTPVVTNNTTYQWFVNGVWQANTTGAFVDTFTTYGYQQVCLMTYNSTTGCRDTVCQSVYIQAPCNFNTTLTYTTSGFNTYNFVANSAGSSSSGSVYRYWILDGINVSQNWGNNYSASLTPGYHTFCVDSWDSVTNCHDSICQTIHVAQPSGCTLTGSLSHVATGSAAVFTASVSGARGGVIYNWSNGASTSNVMTATLSGVYCVTVTDSSGCNVVLCDTFQNPCNLHVTMYDSSQSSGTVHILWLNATGGTPSYTYHWSNGSTSSTRTVTATGQYCATVTDAAGCSATACANVSICNMTAAVNKVVSGSTTYVTGVRTGGTAPFRYHWNTNATSASLQVTASGVYCVTITDTTGCSKSACLSVTLSGCGLNGVVTRLTQGSSTSLTATPSSGTPPYVYHWSTNASSRSITVTQTGNYCVTITDSTGCQKLICSYVTIALPRTDTVCGLVFNDLNGNGVQDAGETGISGQRVWAGSYYTYTDTFGHYNIAVPAGTYLDVYYYNAAGSSVTIPQNLGRSYGYYDTVLIGGNLTGSYRHCGFDFGVWNNKVTIQGTVYLDANANGVQDAGEPGLPYQHVSIGLFSAYTNAQGHYTRTLAAGTYTINRVPSTSYYNNYNAYISIPANRSLTATTIGTTYPGNDFGLSTSNTLCNIAVQVIPHTTVTAGYPAWYDVYVSNYGTNAATGTMTYYFDPVLTFNYASPAQSTLDAVNHFATFNYTNILPGQYKQYHLSFHAATSVVVGQPTFEMATATDNCNESNYNDNTDTLHQTATGSWDPNNKLATPSGEGAQGLIAGTQELRYTINFQNTGTAPAVNVVLMDMIPATLDLSTFNLISTSHPNFSLEIEGQQLLCRFSQIMLPDSGTDEPGSHGYISFTIKPVAGLAAGTVINNKADIYFDYNSAVKTNTTLNTIERALSVNDINNHAVISVVPNPMHEVTTITVEGVNTSALSMDVYDLVGQHVSMNNAENDGVIRFQRGNLTSGIYMYQLRNAGQIIGTGKLIIE